MKINNCRRGENKRIETTERLGKEKGRGIKIEIGIGIVVLFEKTLVAKWAKRIGGNGYRNSNRAITLVTEKRLVDGGGHGGGGPWKQPMKSGEKRRNYEREIQRDEKNGGFDAGVVNSIGR